MRICLFCATRRGLAVLETVLELVSDAEWVVLSFREESWEPAFLDDIRNTAETAGATFIETRGLKPEIIGQIGSVDLILAVNWRYMLAPSFYKKARLGAYIFHDSLLPKYRGFSPTVWAMLNGEKELGATLFEIAQDVDSGRIVDQEAVMIDETETIAEVFGKITRAYLIIIRRSLRLLLTGTPSLRDQDESEATYTCKLNPEDMQINWQAPSRTIYNMIRAYTSPYPGAYTFVDGQKLHILEAMWPSDVNAYVGRVPGRPVRFIEGRGVEVLTGDGLLLIKRVRTVEGLETTADSVIRRLSIKLGE